MILQDIYQMAKAIEDILPEIVKNSNGRDVRKDIEITINLEDKELHDIDAALYQEMNHSLSGFTENDEVDVEVFGINFKLRKKED